jgi:calcineurin-like phosphoesterase family protein
MRETLIANHNAIVKPQDTVIHLGDFSLNLKTVPLVAPRLNGKKILVIGNHDRCFHLKKNAEKDMATYRRYFDEVVIDKHMMVGDYPVYLNHFPFRSNYETERYHMQRPTPDDMNGAVVLVHGHVHNAWSVRDNMINVGVDVRGYAPISEDQLIIEIAKILEK